MKLDCRRTTILSAIILLGSTLIVSCNGAKSVRNGVNAEDSTALANKIDTVKLVRSLKELYSYVPSKTFVETCDLSYQGFEEIPVLKLYNIKRLNLSHNNLRMLYYLDYLPSGLEELDMSSCNIGVVREQDYIKYYSDSFSTDAYLYFYICDLKFKPEKFPNLKVINLLNNNIEFVKAPDYAKVLKDSIKSTKGIENKVKTATAKAPAMKPDTVETVKSLEELYALAPNTVIKVCNLSNKGLTDFPVLRPYNILQLNISGNDFSNANAGRFDQYLLQMLPESLTELDISGCKIGYTQRKAGDGLLFVFKKKYFPNLKAINAARNCFDKVAVLAPVENLNLSRNDLKELQILNKVLKKLDVSYNWDMYDTILFPPEILSILKRDSCAHGKILH